MTVSSVLANSAVNGTQDRNVNQRWYRRAESPEIARTVPEPHLKVPRRNEASTSGVLQRGRLNLGPCSVFGR
jgi:hypothetical protein